MADERHGPEGWLEIEGGEGEAKIVRCPRHDRDMPLAGCLACKRFASLAIDPAGKHVYIDCDSGGGAPPPGDPRP
jgi:hypothetical protein